MESYSKISTKTLNMANEKKQEGNKGHSDLRYQPSQQPTLKNKKNKTHEWRAIH